MKAAFLLLTVLLLSGLPNSLQLSKVPTFELRWQNN